MSKRVGEPISKSINVFDSSGALAALTTCTCSVTLPDGSTGSALVANPTTGVYTATFTGTTIPGRYLFFFDGTGPNAGGLPEEPQFEDILPIAQTFYVDLLSLRRYAGITDTVDDVLLQGALEAASQGIDDYCGRSFYASTTATSRRFSTSRAGVLLVDDIASTDDLAASVDGTLWANTDFDTFPYGALERGRPITQLRSPNRGWFGTDIQITARWGWPTVPAPIKQACLIQSVRLFRRKDSPDGVTGIADIGVMRMTRVDPDVQVLLAPYRIPTLA